MQYGNDYIKNEHSNKYKLQQKKLNKIMNKKKNKKDSFADANIEIQSNEQGFGTTICSQHTPHPSAGLQRNQHQRQQIITHMHLRIEKQERSSTATPYILRNEPTHKQTYTHNYT